MKSNLEPIEENDLNLEAKLKRGSVESVQSQQEAPFQVEKESANEISAAEKDSSYHEILSKVQTQEQTDDSDTQNAVASDSQAGSQKMDAESRVQHLIDLASQKGIVHAVKVAQHMQDNYVLDTMHDKMLVDDLHDALVKKGMIKEI